MAARNTVEHGILLNERDVSQTYSYTVHEHTDEELLSVPSLNGRYATVGGTRVYFVGGEYPEELMNASFTDVDGIVWSIYNEFDGSRYSLRYERGGTLSTIVSGDAQIPFCLYYQVDGNMRAYDPDTDTHFGRIWLRYNNGSQTSLGCICELDRQELPQPKRSYEVEEEVS